MQKKRKRSFSEPGVRFSLLSWPCPALYHPPRYGQGPARYCDSACSKFFANLDIEPLHLLGRIRKLATIFWDRVSAAWRSCWVGEWRAPLPDGGVWNGGGGWWEGCWGRRGRIRRGATKEEDVLMSVGCFVVMGKGDVNNTW